MDIHARNDQGHTAYDLATDSECKFLLLNTIKEARRVQKAVGKLRTLTMGFQTRLDSAGGSTTYGSSLPGSRGNMHRRLLDQEPV